MSYIIGGLFCIWGVIVLINGVFRMNENDFKAKSRFFANIFFELEFITTFLQKLPASIIKSTVIITGTAFLSFGVYLCI